MCPAFSLPKKNAARVLMKQRQKNVYSERRSVNVDSGRKIFSNEQCHLLFWPDADTVCGLQLPEMLRRTKGKVLAEHEKDRCMLQLLRKFGSQSRQSFAWAKIHKSCYDLQRITKRKASSGKQHLLHSGSAAAEVGRMIRTFLSPNMCRCVRLRNPNAGNNPSKMQIETQAICEQFTRAA